MIITHDFDSNDDVIDDHYDDKIKTIRKERTNSHSSSFETRIARNRISSRLNLMI